MRRNIAVTILLIVQLLKALGIDINVGEADVEAIINSGAVLLGVWGTVIDVIRKRKAAKAKNAAA